MQLDDGPSYLQLPYAYWRERLSVPAKAVLLVALTLGDGFPLPYGQFTAWYGFSSSTGKRGLVELRDHGLLHREQHRRADPESPVGYADVYRYALLAPSDRAACARRPHRRSGPDLRHRLPVPVARRRSARSRTRRTARSQHADAPS